VARVSSKVQQMARRKRYCPLCLRRVFSVVKYKAQKSCFSVRLFQSTLSFAPACTTSQLVRNLQIFGLLCWVVALVICCPAWYWNWKDKMFYLTLPSNSTMTMFPENSLSDYTTKIPMDMCLEVSGKWVWQKVCTTTRGSTWWDQEKIFWRLVTETEKALL